MEGKILSLAKFNTVAKGVKGPDPAFWFTKILFWEYHVTTRQPTMMEKRIITLNLTVPT